MQREDGKETTTDRRSWFGVEVRHLLALTAVAREGSFRAAAESLGYVQSAVSQQIAQLEELVRVRLVERCRGSREIHLTEAGELLVAHSEEILARIQAAHADLAAQTNGDETVRVRMAVAQQSIAAALVVEILGHLSRTDPNVRIEPVEAEDDDCVVTLLESGHVDVALSDLALGSSEFKSRTVLSDPCVLLVRSDLPWANGRAPRTIAELASVSLIGLDGWRYQSRLEFTFKSYGVSPPLVQQVRGEGGVRALVGAGLGAAIVPALRADEIAGGVGRHYGHTGHKIIAIDLNGVLPVRHVGLQWNGARLDRTGLEAVIASAERAGRTMASLRQARLHRQGEADGLRDVAGRMVLCH